MCTALLWILLLPRKWAFLILYYCYFRFIVAMEKLILNLHYEIEGRENIPEKGPYIVAMKHQSFYETFLMFHIFGDIRILLKKELAMIPLWGWYTWKTGMIRVDREKGSSAMQSIIKAATPVIKDEGAPILIYPQGTRVSIHDTIEKRPYKFGVIRLYDHFKVPLLPVAMNSGKYWPKHAFLIKPGTVTFKIMPPIAAGQDKDKVYKEMSVLIEGESSKLID
jgi:1-acyl-sn-glycerol-3-phosphate acyltransferase